MCRFSTTRIVNGNGQCGQAAGASPAASQQPVHHVDAFWMRHVPMQESAGGFWSAKGRAKLPDTADLRRSSQFITLTRSHAALVANESRVEPLFAAACTDDQAHDFR